MSWNGSDNVSGVGKGAQKSAHRHSSSNIHNSPLLHGLIAGLIIVAVGGAALWFFMGTEAPQAPKVARHSKKATQSIADNGSNVVKSAVAPVEEAPKKKGKSLKDMTPEERLETIEKRLKEMPAFSPSASNQNFRTATEQLMNWIFNCRLGDTPPPMPNLPLKDLVHFEEILSTPIPIKDTDSDAMIERKKMVDYAKKEFAEYLAKGGKPEEFLTFYRNELIDAHNEFVEYRKQAFKVVQEEPELADQFVAEINKNLEAKGIKPVVIPPPMRKRYGLDAE